MVKQVITNDARVQRVSNSDSASDLLVLGQGKGGREDNKESSQYLAITPCHNSDSQGLHKCPICPANLCKVSDTWRAPATTFLPTTENRKVPLTLLLAWNPPLNVDLVKVCSSDVAAEHQPLYLNLGSMHFLQGRELSQLRKEKPYKRIVYLGDGANDLCPTLKLGHQDIVLARKGYELDRLIQDRLQSDPQCIKATVYQWCTHQELATKIRRLV